MDVFKIYSGAQMNRALKIPTFRGIWLLTFSLTFHGPYYAMGRGELFSFSTYTSLFWGINQDTLVSVLLKKIYFPVV